MKLNSFEIKRNSKDTGDIAKAKFEVVEGEYGPVIKDGKQTGGLLVFETFNLTNPNPIAVDISTKKLNEMLSATNTGESVDSLGHDFSVIPEVLADSTFIGVVKRDASFKDSNGNYIKLTKENRDELNSLMEDELEDRGLEKVVANKLVKFMAS